MHPYNMIYTECTCIQLRITHFKYILHGIVHSTSSLSLLHMQVRQKDHHVFLADFGLAQVISTSPVLGTKTMQSGTPGFQAPEQLRAESVDEGVDVYGFGAVLIEFFGEKPVWAGLNPYQIIVKVVVNGEVPGYGHLPHSIQLICNDCLKPRVNRSKMTGVLKALLQIRC